MVFQHKGQNIQDAWQKYAPNPHPHLQAKQPPIQNPMLPITHTQNFGTQNIIHTNQM